MLTLLAGPGGPLAAEETLAASVMVLAASVMVLYTKDVDVSGEMRVDSGAFVALERVLASVGARLTV